MQWKIRLSQGRCKEFVRFKWQNQKAATKDPEDFVSTIAGYLLPTLYAKKTYPLVI